MKRYRQVKYAVASFAVVAAMLSGCGRSDPQKSLEHSAVNGWQQPPSVISVSWRGQMASVSGMASPAARVIFAGERGEAYAVSADADGNFVLVINVPEAGLLLRPRAQVGTGAVEGQGALFLASGMQPVAAILFAGEGAYRLDGGGLLDAVDADGEALILSGRSEKGRDTTLVVDGQNVTVNANEDGRWAVVAPDNRAPVEIVLNGVGYRFPGIQKAAGVRAINDSGWLVTRDFGGNAVQSTWLPSDK